MKKYISREYSKKFSINVKKYKEWDDLKLKKIY